MANMTFTSQCCHAPIHTDTGDKPVMRCSQCKTIVGNDGVPIEPDPEPDPLGLFDHIWNGFEHQSDEVLEQCVESGHFYTPYIPLQVTKVKLK